MGRDGDVRSQCVSVCIVWVGGWVRVRACVSLVGANGIGSASLIAPGRTHVQFNRANRAWLTGIGSGFVRGCLCAGRSSLRPHFAGAKASNELREAEPARAVGCCSVHGCLRWCCWWGLWWWRDGGCGDGSGGSGSSGDNDGMAAASCTVVCDGGGGGIAGGSSGGGGGGWRQCCWAVAW